MKNFYQNIADGWIAATYSYARGCRYTLQGTPVGWGPSSTHLDQSSFFAINRLFSQSSVPRETDLVKHEHGASEDPNGVR